jgi:hypothetical protein
VALIIRKNIFFMVLRKKNVSIIRLERAFIPTMDPRLEQEKKNVIDTREISTL